MSEHVTTRIRSHMRKASPVRWFSRREPDRSTEDYSGDGSGSDIASDSGATGAPRAKRGMPPRWAGSAWFILLIASAIALVAVMVVPRSNAPVGPGTLVVASLPFWNLTNGTDTVVENKELINEASPWIYGLDRNGEIIRQHPPDMADEVSAQLDELRDADIPLVPSLANITDGRWAYEQVARMLHDPALRNRHISEIVEIVEREDYDGIDVDYENLRATDREVFTTFITDLAAALHAEDKTLSVALFAKTNESGYDERNVAQDYAAIGKAADQVRLMAYDFHWPTSPPGPVAPIGWVREVLEYAKSRIPAERIVLGVPFYGYDWVDGRGTSVTWLQAFQLATEHNAETTYDPRTQSPSFRYTDGRGRTHEVWFENAVSSKAKFEAARGAGIRGVYLWMYGYEDSGTWSHLDKSLPVGD
ncbi:glycosyl hydrolase family 18 protein [Parasphingorhabdus pacifica]